MSKQTDLLKLLMPILYKYDYLTVKKSLQYILDNEEKFKTCKKMNDEFVKEIDNANVEGKNKTSNEIKSIINEAERNKKAILKKIYMIVTNKKLKLEQLSELVQQEKVDCKELEVNSLDKLFEILSMQDVDKLKKLENIIIANSKLKSSQNSLENWSNLIIKK